MPHIRRGPTATVIGPAASVPIKRERLHEAAQHGEDLTPALVRHDLLDQGDVTDETDTVTHPEDDGADTSDREIRADGADRHTGRRDEERGAVARRTPSVAR